MNIDFNLEETLSNELNSLLNINIESSINKISFTNKNKLVMSGGGLKGIALVGALKCLDDLGCLSSINTIIGTSVGALVGLLLVIGYSTEELYDFLLAYDVIKLQGIKLDNLTKFGLDDGTKFMLALKTMVTTKGYSEDVTFTQLYDKTKIKYINTATCLNTKSIIYHSVDTNPNMSVLLSVRMSISVPLYFTPVLYEDKLYVDGGCIDNYAIQLLNGDLNDVIGIYLSDIRPVQTNITNIEDYLTCVIESLLEGITYNSLKGFEKCTVRINVSSVSLINMSLNREQREKLLQIGYKTILELSPKTS